MTVDATHLVAPAWRRRVIWAVAFLAGIVLVVSISSIGVANRSPDRSSEPEVESDQSVSWERQRPDQFAATISTAPEFVVNVHVPEDGEIAQTDASIAYDRVVNDPSLPGDKSAPIALYCRSGRMSTIAAEALVADGRMNVIELEGGMDAWEQDGRSLAPPR